MKRKELRRLISHFLKLNAEMTGSSTKVLTQLQAKLHYLDIISGLPSYGAKCFSTNQREGVERVLLVSPRFGLSQISSVRNSVPQPISAIEDFMHVIVTREDDVTCSVSIFMHGDRTAKFLMEDRDACEFSLVLAGYYRLLTGKELHVEREREQYEEDNAPSYLTQHTVLPAAWSYLLPFRNHPHSINFLMPAPYHPMKQDKSSLETMSLPAQCDRNMNSASVANSNHKSAFNKTTFMNTAAMDVDFHSVMATELLEEAKDSGMSDSSGGGSYERQPNNNSALVEAKNEEVLRRVQEMQKMVENSEQYLTEQGELLHEYELQRRSIQTGNNLNSTWPNEQTTNGGNIQTTSGVFEFDSDCDSLNSSKVSSTEETPQPGALKHSDSLVLLAESINQDLSGINKGLNSICGSQQNLAPRRPSISATCSPRPERKFNGFSQLLSNLQALGTDFSQSESDSESVNSPTNSPTTRRPAVLVTTGSNASERKQSLNYRSSFGLHSPDSSNFVPETKDYNLREYLKQLKEISNMENMQQDTDVAAKKLSEIYGFEVREDTFIETDVDLIDLRAIPPPQTPDELDALTILNAAPHGFDDGTTSKRNTNTAAAVGMDGELDKFLAKVVVAPPTQRATPAKELTPEEIMSFIIPPPPNLDEIAQAQKPAYPAVAEECLYSNSVTAKREFFDRNFRSQPSVTHDENKHHAAVGHVIEYATVERKSKFSCCPKSKKNEHETIEEESLGMAAMPSLTPPPRLQAFERIPPARPPKSVELMQRYSPKKQLTFTQSADGISATTTANGMPPQLPPRISASVCHERCLSPTVSVAPKKPPLPPIANRSILRAPTTNGGMSPTPTTPLPATTRSFPIANNQAVNNVMHSNGHCRSNSDCPSVCLSSPTAEKRAQLSLLCSPQLNRKVGATNNANRLHNYGDKIIIKNGHIIDGEALLAKTDVAMAGLLVKLDQVAAQCTAAQSAGGGTSIDEDKFQRARNELTEQTLVLVTASKFLVVAMSDMTLSTLPEHLTSCLTAIRRITELTQDMTRHTSAPLQTRNIVLKVHDVAASFRELVGVQIGPLGAGQLALQAECLANVLATLLRSLRVFSP